jgi:hypothetical protein
MYFFLSKFSFLIHVIFHYSDEIMFISKQHSSLSKKKKILKYINEKYNDLNFIFVECP